MSRKLSYGDIGKRLKLVRDAEKLNQQAFAATLGIKQSWLSELESGVKEPSDVLLVALEYRYAINRTWILTGEGEMSRTDHTGHSTLQEERASYNASPCFNLSFMAEIIEAVEEIFESENLHLPPPKKAELITLLYEELCDDKSRIQALKGRVLKLVKLAS